MEETRSTVLEVKAETPEYALQKVEKAYEKDEVCLNHVDYIDDGACFMMKQKTGGNASRTDTITIFRRFHKYSREET